MQVKTTVEPLHHGHHGDRRKRSLWRGGRDGEVGCNTTIFFFGGGEYNTFIEPSSCLLYPIVVIQSHLKVI